MTSDETKSFGTLSISGPKSNALEALGAERATCRHVEKANRFKLTANSQVLPKNIGKD